MPILDTLKSVIKGDAVANLAAEVDRLTAQRAAAESERVAAVAEADAGRAAVAAALEAGEDPVDLEAKVSASDERARRLAERVGALRTIVDRRTSELSQAKRAAKVAVLEKAHARLRAQAEAALKRAGDSSVKLAGDLGELDGIEDALNSVRKHLERLDAPPADAFVPSSLVLEEMKRAFDAAHPNVPRFSLEKWELRIPIVPLDVPELEIP